MIKILDSKVAFITALFGVFGLVLIKILDIRNLPSFVTGMGMLFSLILSFICSTLLLSKISVSKRNRLTLVSTILFVTSVYLFFNLQKKVDNLTVEVKQFSGDSTVVERYFIGTVYTPEAFDYKSNNENVSNKELIAASENDIYNVWTTESIKQVIREITLVYYLFIFSIVLSISLLTEILNKRVIRTSAKKAAHSVIFSIGSTIFP